ncbi:MAG: hypothetical protein A2234_03875 [Elusimicrobia bacterium RIFOXYA2_FULL_58_8]|nr:MAG: hypothetical protein A2234_03875 [Elusimicrobia bacterium RIFOXYA2_FULL_58_8]
MAAMVFKNRQKSGLTAFPLQFSAPIFLAVLCLLPGCPVAAQKARRFACPGCNVILVSLDALRADAIGAYGYPRATTPNLDRLAGGAAGFLNAWAHAPNTLPSHMSIFTSQYPWRHKVEVIHKDRLAQTAVTLPMALQLRGYLTVWDAHTNHPHLGLAAGFERGFDMFYSCVPLRHRPRNHKSEWRPAFRWLEENGNRKFFMFLHTANMHNPYTRDKASLRRFQAGQGVSKVMSPEEVERRVAEHIAPDPALAYLAKVLNANAGIFAMRDFNAKHRALLELITQAGADSGRGPSWAALTILHKFFADSPGDMAALRAAYDASVFEADAMLGRLYARLEALGLADKTLLVITADHGEEFLEHGRLGHSQLYAENLHVPLMFIFPGDRPAKRLARPVQSIDVAPTILDAVGLPPLAGAQGRSLLPLMEGTALPGPAALALARWRGSYSARDGRHTYVLKNNCPYPYQSWNAACLEQEFYDRAADPGELVNIFSASKEIAAGFAARLAGETGANAGELAAPWPAGITQETRKTILDTGYW